MNNNNKLLLFSTNGFAITLNTIWIIEIYRQEIELGLVVIRFHHAIIPIGTPSFITQGEIYFNYISSLLCITAPMKLVIYNNDCPNKVKMKRD